MLTVPIANGERTGITGSGKDAPKTNYTHSGNLAVALFILSKIGKYVDLDTTDVMATTAVELFTAHSQKTNIDSTPNRKSCESDDNEA